MGNTAPTTCTIGQSTMENECFLPFLRLPFSQKGDISGGELFSVPPERACRDENTANSESESPPSTAQKTAGENQPITDNGSVHSNPEHEEIDEDEEEEEDPKLGLPSSNTKNIDGQTALDSPTSRNPWTKWWFGGEPLQANQKPTQQKEKETFVRHQKNQHSLEPSASNKQNNKFNPSGRDTTSCSSSVPRDVVIIGSQKLKTGVIVPPTKVVRRKEPPSKRAVHEAFATTLNATAPPAHVALVEDFEKGMAQIQLDADRSVHGQTTGRTQKRAIHLQCGEATGRDPIREKLFEFLAECELFRASKNKKVEISLGYHYTSPEYLRCIQRYGLLNRQERQDLNICVRENGQTHGLGIYTSSNPMAFHKFRDHTTLGLYVLRLTGVTGNGNNSSGVGSDTDQLHPCDTVTKQRGIGKDVMVLRSSAQCVVLGHFSGQDLHDSKACAAQILVAHGKLVKLIRQTLQHYCDNSPVAESSGLAEKKNKMLGLDPIRVASRIKQETKEHTKRNGKRNKKSSSRQSMMPRYACLKYGAPKHCLMVSSLKECTDKVEPCPQLKDQECSICFEKLYQGNCRRNRTSRFFNSNDEDGDDGSGSLLALKRCSHIFHRDCLREALKFDGKCPICRKISAEPIGKCPSGRMEIGLDTDLICQGFELEQHGRDDNIGTWRIRYSIRSGTQKPYHENPNVPYSSTAREAFLPNTEDGRRLLKRLTYAFSRGLTFTVGTSLTSGKENVVVWASIHHKTRPNSGMGVVVGGNSNPHGFPDKGYFMNCNEELDALGVPQHDDPSLQIVFSTKCATSVNFGSLFSTEENHDDDRH